MNKQIFFAVFNLIWTTLFLESWKRYSANLSYKWGTIDKVKFQEPRPEYKGEMVIDEITGKREPLEHPWREDGETILRLAAGARNQPLCR